MFCFNIISCQLLGSWPRCECFNVFSVSDGSGLTVVYGKKSNNQGYV